MIYKITLENRTTELNKLITELEQLSKIVNLSAKCLLNINLAIEELVLNIINYGYQDDANHIISIEFYIQDNLLEIIIIDDGIPFNPLLAKVPNTNLTIEEREIGGLGIYFVKQTMQDLSYFRKNGLNIFSMKINL